jgi:glycosyltransferase involved in cell wall biosynthesis
VRWHLLGIPRRARCLAPRLLATTATIETAEKSVLFVSPVWPERSSSAAGVRTADLIASFQSRAYDVAYASPSAANDHTRLIQDAGIAAFECPPNNESAFADVLAATRPSVLIFDRFYAEEMFSFRVKDLVPKALRVLDMQDIHFLREGRQAVAKAAGAGIADVMATRPDATSPSCLREIASIYRSDLTLVVSPVELDLLAGHYGVPRERLALAPFFAPPSPHEAAPVPYNVRNHFIMIGNFRHPPNFDSVRWAVAEVWPRLRAALKGSSGASEAPELHIYGSYAPQAATELHRPSQGVHFKGFAPTLDIMTQYRVCLAPLRFGAGLKGKIVESWWHGLPVCTTAVGAEGMTAADAGDDGADSPWGGLYGGATAEELAADAARLYTDQELWESCQRAGFSLLRRLYDAEGRLAAVHGAIEGALEGLEERRAQDFVGQVLWQQQVRSTEYFSRWIELKERGGGGGGSGGA